jgi:radical SAM superfamily enzyme YgiQ (UPF0313 family)
MYKTKKFTVRSWDEIEQDIDSVAHEMRPIRRVFLADGDALALETSLLLKVLRKLYKTFPNLERVGVYAGPKDILNKSEEELKQLYQAGVKILYLGLETGSDRLLQAVRKGVNAAQMIEAGRKALDCGFELSVTVITGLGGQEYWHEHAVETARVASAINPTYLGALTLMVVPGTALHRQIEAGEFKLLNTGQTLMELKVMLDNVDLRNCIFRSNHASNYLPLRGTLNRDRNKLVAILDRALTDPSRAQLRPEFMRGL